MKRTIDRGHKAQHWIPARAYLAAWADPDVPRGHEPYVWVISKDCRSAERRAPANVFWENDLYTIKKPDGSRDLSLELELLGNVEQAFAIARRDFLEKHRRLPAARHAALLAFVAAMHARTPAMRDHHAGQWREVLRKMEELDAELRRMPPEERKARRPLPPLGVDPKDRGMTIEDVQRLTGQMMPNMLPAMMRASLPQLIRMRVAVLCTKSEPGFITSDAPVVFFDPDAYKRPPMWRSTGFMYPRLEITLPVSPSQALLVHHGESGLDYVDAPDATVDGINRRTLLHCRESFVVKRGYVRPIWTDPGERPADAWELVHASEIEEAQRE